ncbi:alpha/beta fold hydrolase [Pseudonocardia endophytica]|uniref:2-hydroxy-6-oxonona-2,4-dienedioate hydrolase/4,5:9,10-diseco-3-hydroxy-5,9, 17-trioxoandrosta-1(10),2-diene-4-oate hydrolase n=1 Tax=Pseudonocardia endophytica TaxID=401976 RepID=A0A4R1I150_PSEEN|nr:alpha/beta fold hydrolase [Pseudonocardia endophytica]TCK27641.1 2-hydroxy-6-oxonona-2,4-dienedioate hydrolase/4,5:9,10-diseco-3-hydroxy-5,9,17-trioxoandrosta-1(10),2-diene-4-oate hydrolase [Pseudonocardia endophytica]
MVATLTQAPSKPAVHTESTVHAGGREIALTEVSSAGGPVRETPLVLLHGGGPGASGMSNYVANVDALAADGYRVLVPDLPGYGRSSKGIDRSDPFGDLAVSVRSLLDALDIERAALLGNSYGGAAALRLALDRPDRVERMVLMGPGGVGTTRALPTAGLSALLDYYTGEGPSRAKLRAFLRDYLVFDPSTVTEEMVEQRYLSSVDPEVIADPPLQRPSGLSALRTALRMDFTRDSRMARCTVPTLVVWGTEDKVNRPSGGAWLARTMPDCDLHLFARTGHWAQHEQAERFNRLVLGWLDGAL